MTRDEQIPACHCGGEAVLRQYYGIALNGWVVDCAKDIECGSGTHSTGCQPSEAEALRMWRIQNNSAYTDDPEHWSRKLFSEYDGSDCENCGRQRVLMYANKRRICEKCNWDQVSHDYAADHERIG